MMRLKKRGQKSKLVNVSRGYVDTKFARATTRAIGPWVLPTSNGNRRAVQRPQSTVVVGGFLTFEPERHFSAFSQARMNRFHFFFYIYNT